MKLRTDINYARYRWTRTEGALEAKKAQQELERLVLELEHKYGLIADGRTVDPRTATIQGTSHVRRANGKESQEALEPTALEAAAK